MYGILQEKIAKLFPGYFSMVMATGALSIAMYLLKIPLLPRLLLYFNVIVYVMLWILNLIRVVKYGSRVISDLTSHSMGPGFFTCVAGTCVLGSQIVVVTHSYAVPTVLWGGESGYGCS